MSRRVFITVAEVSGDRHAANLIRCLRALDPTLIIEGHGGPEMAAAGAVIHHETVRRAAMGWQAALRVMEVRRLLKWTKRHLDQNHFDLQICVDSWAMNCHFAKLARDRGVPVMYYIAPQTWASREGRIKKMRLWIDRIACILPFEEEYFRRHGVEAEFVGHPLFDQISAEPVDINPGKKAADHPPVIGLLAGSRRSVTAANFPRLLAVADRIRKIFPQVRFLCPTTSATHHIVNDLAAGRGDIEISQDAFNEMVPRCDLCITVSGTASLHAAAMSVPQVVVYYGNPILWHLIGRWIVKTRTYSLINLLSDSREPIVPEFIPWHGSTQPAADCAIDLLKHPEKLHHQREKMRQAIQPLRQSGASKRAAAMAMEMMAGKVKTPNHHIE